CRFIVMEYIQGDPLAKLLASQKPVNSELAINLTLQILNGLQRAHGMGILHRDIKPDNILITQDNTVKILDFGIAKLQNKQGLTVGGDILGTIEYMAPEQMMGETVDQRCDIYSVGILLYQTLTRQLPFPTDSPAAILYKKLNEDPIPPSHYNQQISTQLDNVILKAICDYENRWPSAQDFAENLGSVLNGASTQPQKIPATPDIQIDSIDGEVESTDQESNAEQFRPVFIGRNKELKKLVNMYGQASHGKGQVVIVAGEAGVGKSTLANQFRRYVRNSQGFVLYGASLYQEGMDAYMPYIDALRGFFSPENLSLSADNRMNLKEMIREKVPL
ncbi:MAG: protein kinase, partial [Aliifodinibius sp.]|nr:protein kinase [Fodinibius sp.]